jgi:FkbM family methyltransferase
MEHIPHNFPEHDRWNLEDGDNTHRLNYDLNENSIVFDLGGYKGEWSENIYNRYNCNIYIFEPVKEFYAYIVNRFKDNNKIKVYNFGLSDFDGIAEIGLNEDSSSHILNQNDKIEIIKLVSINKFINENNVNSVDLIKINIESAEYDLLESLINEKNITVFRDIQVQFHTFIPDCVERRNNIRNYLAKTHYLTYDFTFIWENWKKI